MGLIDSSMKPAEKQVAKQAKPSSMDPLLQKAMQQHEAKVPKEIRKNYDAIVVSGMKIMYDEKTNGQMIEMLQKTGNIVPDVVQGIITLLAIISQEAKGKALAAAASAAAYTLMYEALDFASKSMDIEITNQLLDECTLEMKPALLKLMKITPEMEQQAVQAGQAKQGGQPQPAQPGAI